MMEITVKVPEELVPDFYALYAQFLKDSKGTAPADVQDWSAGDVKEATHVWSQMSPKARQLFQLLPAAPDTIDAEELVKVLGETADATTVAGTFGWPARYAREVGRKQPTRGREVADGTVYWVEPTVKAAFEKAGAVFE